MNSIKLKQPDLSYLNLNADKVHYQLNVSELVEEALKNKEGTLASSGALGPLTK